MIEFRYLQTGITALARAHRAGTMAGHLGAAVVAGYFYGEDHAELPEEVCQGIEGELERVIAGEEGIWWNVEQAGIKPEDLFQPLDQQAATPDGIDSIADALAENVGQLRQSGHNIIFAALALRALQDHPDFATPQTIAGIRKLTAGFQKAHPGRGYYGKEKGWLLGHQVKLTDDARFAPYNSIQDMVNVSIDELIATAAVRKQGFGGLWHLVNHAAAITEINRFGYRQLAQNALPAHHFHVELWRSLPDVSDELGNVEKSPEDPRQPAYWNGMLKRDQARLTHRVKTLYGYGTLRRWIEDEGKRNQADEALRYLMA
ncbi:hypothetical protein [Blastopirellula retiformator]|uniref:Uncharacterized protein n=1 Tax=Blastopirellula retiformator TaxID=2527970 RepID=A0A5C5V6Z4_9BACT|nr:hypothetical protein [Blastopirellula retiformator]TWT34296.1 hypothetical protein Enr8_16900 [Blastopirellula retiformator]